jgi:hypothetical protein
MPAKPPDTARTASANGDQAEVIAFFESGTAFGDAPRDVDTHVTHGALVFLAGDDAYKIKKAVKFAYMDFSTRELRRRALEREFEINRPLAAQLYRGVVAVTREKDGSLRINGAGEPIEWALRLWRFEQNALLSAIARNGAIEPKLCRDLAEAIHACHEAAAVHAAADSAAQMRAIASEIVEVLQPLGERINSSDVRELGASLGRLERHGRPLLGRRAAAGLVRRCHGDLHLNNIVVVDGKPVLFDALEFDEELATIDTLYDLAFLLMDLDRHGDLAAANRVLNAYLWRTQRQLDLEGLALLPLFLASRAGVRAMVEAQRALQQEASGSDKGFRSSQAYLALGLSYARPIRSVLIAVGGLSGTGKSTLSAHLAPALGKAPGALHLRSDLERKAMFGVAEMERLPQEAYTPQVSQQVYDRLVAKAEACLAAGHAVVVDAVHASSAERAAIERLAGRLDVPFFGLWLEAPRAEMLSRVDARTGDASDATAQVVEKQLGYDLGEIGWRRLSSAGTPAETLKRAQDALRVEKLIA